MTPPPTSTEPTSDDGGAADEPEASSESQPAGGERERADAALEAALERTGARDPREFYRTRLMELKGSSEEAYDAAVAYFTDTLVPSVAGGADPLPAWTEYGRELAELVEPGRTVSVDPTGRSETYAAPADPDHLVLHLPASRRAPTLLVGLPVELSDAQRATYDFLVANRNSLRD